MSEKPEEQDKEEQQSAVEKPVSLAGPKFKDVLKALLETKPMPKGEKNAGEKSS